LDGDTVVALDGKKIHLYREISLYSMLNRGEDIAVTYQRDGQIYDTVISPVYDEQAGRYYMGLYGVGKYEKMGIFGTIRYSAYEVGYWIHTTVKSLELLVQGQVTKDDVSGPVGMAQTVNEIYTESKPSGIYYIWLNMLNFAILLSANLGVLNLLPFPALDGGRLVFLFVEAVRGKPVPPEKEGLVHLVGMVCLMLLMVFVLYNDLTKIF
jgi:regulator of sigma E protease